MAIAAFPLDIEPDVASSPPSRRATDVSTLTMPIAWVWVIVIAVVSFAVNQAWTLSGVRSDVRDMSTRMEARDKAETERAQAEREIKELEKRYLEQRFATLESKIETAGLRNAALAMTQQLEQQRK